MSPYAILNMTDWVPDCRQIERISDLESVISRMAGAKIGKKPRALKYCTSASEKLIFKLNIDLQQLVYALWRVRNNPETKGAFDAILSQNYRRAEFLITKNYGAGSSEHRAIVNYALLTSLPRIRRFSYFCHAWLRAQRDFSNLPFQNMKPTTRTYTEEGLPEHGKKSGPNLLGSSAWNSIELVLNYSERSLLQAEVNLMKRKPPRALNGDPEDLERMHELARTIAARHEKEPDKLDRRQSRLWGNYFRALRRKVVELEEYLSFIQDLRIGSYERTAKSAGLNEGGHKNCHAFRQWAAGQSMLSLQAAFIFELALVAGALNSRLAASSSVKNGTQAPDKIFRRSKFKKPLPNINTDKLPFGITPYLIITIAKELFETLGIATVDNAKRNVHISLASLYIGQIYGYKWSKRKSSEIRSGLHYTNWMWKNLYTSFGLFGNLTAPYTPQAVFLPRRPAPHHSDARR